MPTAPSDRGRDGLSRLCSRRATRQLRLRLATLSLGAGLICSAGPLAWAETAAVSHSSKAPAVKPAPSPTPKKQPYDKKWGKLEGNAVWYPVPVNSLAKRRAGKNELTAAHNRLPLGAMVRVTHLGNGKTVVVRITDRVGSRRVLIDLCKEAAEKLGMISEGSARVRLEILPDDAGTNEVPPPKTAAARP